MLRCCDGDMANIYPGSVVDNLELQGYYFAYFYFFSYPDNYLAFAD